MGPFLFNFSHPTKLDFGEGRSTCIHGQGCPGPLQLWDTHVLGQYGARRGSGAAAWGSLGETTVSKGHLVPLRLLCLDHTCARPHV